MKLEEKLHKALKRKALDDDMTVEATVVEALKAFCGGK